MSDLGGALARVVRRVGGTDVLDALADRLPGADLTTLLLQVMRRRAGRLTPPDVLRQYATDRFTQPAAVPFGSLRRAEDAVLSVLPDDVEMVTCSPVAPLGTHSALATVDQNKVVSTIRRTEVAADPTNTLALEAALRRRSDPTRPVRLATLQRVTRAQRFGPGAPAHFTLFGAVTAGRDTGNATFERRHLLEHLRLLAGAVRAAGHQPYVRLTSLKPGSPHTESIIESLAAGLAQVSLEQYQGRQSGHGYYTGWCFKVGTVTTEGWYEIADGGFVDWTQRLLGNRKERLLISGLGVDRLAGVSPEISDVSRS